MITDKAEHIRCHIKLSEGMVAEKMADDSWENKPLGYRINTGERAYKDGFKDAVNMFLDKLKEVYLKETESQFLSILDGISSWKADSSKEG